MTVPEIRWQQGNYAGLKGRVGSINTAVFDIAYLSSDRYSLRAYLPGFTGVELLRGTEEECKAYARRVLATWLRKFTETPEDGS